MFINKMFLGHLYDESGHGNFHMGIHQTALLHKTGNSGTVTYFNLDFTSPIHEVTINRRNCTAALNMDVNN